jgi:hypothetical protein
MLLLLMQLIPSPTRSPFLRSLSATNTRAMEIYMKQTFSNSNPNKSTHLPRPLVPRNDCSPSKEQNPERIIKGTSLCTTATLADKQTPDDENTSSQEESEDELDFLTPSKQRQRRDNPILISPRSSSSGSPLFPLDPALENLGRPSGALVTKSVPLHPRKRKHRQDDSDSDEPVTKKKKKHWTPATNDPEHVEEWWQVALLFQRWYIDNGPVAMGQGGDEEIRMEMWNRYKYVFGDDAPPLIDEKWDRARWVSSTC